MNKKVIMTVMLFAVMFIAFALQSASDYAAADASQAGNDPSAYTMEEVWFERDGLRIYGELCIPEISGKLPLVILSHGFGVNHTRSQGYARAFAENGIAAYAFDFIGGGRDIKSDGQMTEMSVLTEAADLNAVIDGLLVRDEFDPSELYLFGAS